MRRFLLLALLGIGCGTLRAHTEVVSRPEVIRFDDAPCLAARKFVATAYALPGRTASGARVRRGLIAADKRFAFGTKLRIHGAGPYDGVYTVADRGGAIRGQHIDLYIPSRAEAMRFGRRVVYIEVVAG